MTEEETLELFHKQHVEFEKIIAQLKLEIHQLELRYINQQNLIAGYIKEIEDLNRGRNG